MKKNNWFVLSGENKLKKLLLMTKFTICMLLIGMFTANAGVLSQNQKVTLSMKDVSLKTVIWEIEKQSGFVFMYSTNDLNKTDKVDVEAVNKTVKDVLTECLEGTGLSFIVNEDVIVIKPAAKAVQTKQEEITVKGVVTDETGFPLPGVSVVLKGTSTGTATDIDGNFTLDVPGKSSVLVVSFMGMISQEITVGDKTSFNVVLKEDRKQLEEVVVTGYQTISKERATGSFDMIDKKDIEKPAANIGSRLVGKVSGVQATMDEDGNPTFQIRGKSSLNADANPLVVVDGFPIEGDFSSINPNDVASVTILKDAAAASIWGARSANGVIVVTTKNASKLKAGSVKVDINSFVQYSPKPDVDYLLNQASSKESIDYAKMSFGKQWGVRAWPESRNELYTPGNAAYEALRNYEWGHLTAEQRDALLTKYASQNNHKQIKDNLMDNPLLQQYNVSIAMASEKSNNSISILYQDRNKYLKGDDNQKVMINYRNFTKLFDWLDFSFAGMYSNQSSNNNGSLSAIKTIAPYEMLLDSEGNRAHVTKNYDLGVFNRHWNPQGLPYSDMSYNPITEMENTDKTTKEIQSRFQAALTFKPIDGLNIRSQFQYETVNVSRDEIYGEKSFYVRDKVNYYAGWNKDDNTYTVNLPKGDIYDQYSSEVRSYTFRNQADFNKTYGDHSFNAVAGFEINKKVYETQQYPRIYGYNGDKLSVGKLPNGYGSYTNENLGIKNWWGSNATIYENVVSKFGYNLDKFFSCYFNLGYTYKDKYSLSASARTDASNLITDDPSFRYSPFWSVGGSWQVKREDFMADVNWVDRLILRATFGYNGNVDRSTSFLPLISMDATNDSHSDEPSAKISSYGNPTLRWEKTGTFDMGVDYTLFGGKMFGKFDIYYKKANDLVASVSIPQVNGVGSQKMNVADMVNKGFEMEIGTKQNIAEGVELSGNLNLSYNNNEIVNLYTTRFTHSDLLKWNGGQASYVEGKDANTIWGCEYARLDKNNKPQIVSKDGKTYFPLSGWPAADVMTYAHAQGTTVAPWLTALSLNLRIKDFDISCIMTGKFGHVFRRTSYNYCNKLPNSLLSEVINAGKDSDIMPLPQNDNENRYGFWDRFWKSYTYLTEPADLIRMQEIAVAYTVPTSKISKYGIKNLRIYSQVNNVFSVFANDYDEDPEYLLGSYKPTAMYTFGVNISF